MTGRPPKPKPVAQNHIRLSEDEIQILTEMGAGRTVDKIKHLIKKEGDRLRHNKPVTRIEMLAKWEKERKEAMKFVALTNENRKKLIGMGFTEEELDKAEEGETVL
jgi:hypothetical protein